MGIIAVISFTYEFVADRISMKIDQSKYYCIHTSTSVQNEISPLIGSRLLENLHFIEVVNKFYLKIKEVISIETLKNQTKSLVRMARKIVTFILKITEHLFFGIIPVTFTKKITLNQHSKQKIQRKLQ